mgnify:CR=1 FL=1
MLVAFLISIATILAQTAIITITSPSGGETFNSGDRIEIKWIASNVDHFEISYTTDSAAPCQGAPNGTFGGICTEGSWICIQMHPYTLIAFNWTAPNISSQSVRIRVEGHSDMINHNAITNDCTEEFSIVQPPPPPKQIGSINGSVKNANSAALLANVSVFGVTPKSTLTDTNGFYSLSDLEIGDYVIRVSAANYIEARDNTTIVANKTLQKDFILQLNGDVTNDCKVNIFDLANVGKCFAEVPQGSCEKSDINKDGVINITDLATVGKTFGNSC